MQKNILVNIQFLRAIAALMVIMYHTTGHYYAIGGEKYGNIFSLLEQFGYVGVDIFFVISGYIIWLTTRKISNIKGIFGFIYNRATRIYLGYWAFFIPVLIFYSYLGRDMSSFDILGSFFLLTISINELLIPVSWTLSYELYFYSLFTFLLFLPKRSIIFILIFLFIAVILVQTWAYFSLDIYSHSVFPTASIVYTFFMSPYTLEFIAGCFVANYFEYRRIKNFKTIIMLGFIFLVLGVYYQNNYLGDSLALGYYMPQRVFFFGLMSTFFLASVVEMNKRNMLIFPRFSLMVGDASYSLYLSHIILLFIFYHIGLRGALEDIASYQTLLMLLLVLVIVLYSVLHYRFIEFPILNLFKKLKKYLKLD